MKTPKIVGEIEHRAGRQLNLLLGAARKQYDRFMNTAEKASDKAAQRRYIRAAEQTIDSAEKIIAQLRKRIAAAQKSLTGGARKKKRKVKARAKRAVKRLAKKVAKRALKKRKTRR
jgi:predicted metal-dependent phosphoesterase TrpH